MIEGARWRTWVFYNIPLILFVVVVAPIWIIAHYTTRWRTAKSLTPEDEKQFAELWQIAERMEERMGNIERILDAEAPPAGEQQK